MRFSVIVPVYNVVDYLSFAIESLLLQDFDDWEAICVDDGSTDGSGELLDRYASRDARVKVFHSTNAGVSAARNLAMEQASGEYLVFLDADDAYVINALSYLNEIIERQREPDLIVYSSVSCREHRPYVSVDCDITEFQRYEMNEKKELQQAFRRLLGTLIAWNGCVRRASVRDCRFRLYSNGEDILWGAECLMSIRNVVISPAPIYRHLDRPGSASQTISVNHARSAIGVSKELILLFEDWDDLPTIKSLVFRRLFSEIMGYTKNVLDKLSSEEQKIMHGEFCSVVKLLCASKLVPSRILRVYLYVASSCVPLRWLLLYVPFEFYSRLHLRWRT